MNFFTNLHKKPPLKTRIFIPMTMILCLLTSCFTGIESTKKINLSREDKKNMTPSKEERFMAQIESMPLKDWENGKQFIVSDNKALLVIVPEQGLLPYAPDSIKGSILEFNGVKSKMNAAGDLNLEISFTDGIYIYSYNTGKEFDSALEEIKSDQIPMLIDLDMITQARQLLLNQKFWSKTNLWYDEQGNRIDGKKYVEVAITGVEAGNMIFPLRLEIETPDKHKAYVFMNFGSGDTESRSFHNLFSMTDIRKHYPAIEPETWDYISQGKVKEGMTKDEVRLSLGNPDDLNSGHDYSQTLDIWSYRSGKVLWFEDGRLVRIRQ